MVRPIDVVWLRAGDTPSRDLCWDMALITEALDGALWRVPNGYELVSRDDWSELPVDQRGCVLVIPGRYCAEASKRKEIERRVRELRWCLVIITSDEEGTFDFSTLDEMDHVALWVMTPGPWGTHDRTIGEGFPHRTREMIAERHPTAPYRMLDWAFAGQVTHSRRFEMARMLRNRRNGRLVETEGFTQGLPREEYLELLCESQIALCPSGPETVDSFRLYEALEAGCVPIVETSTPRGPQRWFFPQVFGDRRPFELVESWNDAPLVIERVVNSWPQRANEISAEWQGYKRDLVHNLHGTIDELSGYPHGAGEIDDQVTIIMPTSPVPSNPSTDLIAETIESVRFHFPTAEIIITIDGVRDEQENRRGPYAQFVRELLWLTNHRWRNVVPMMHETHQHQANMTRAALDLVSTPAILFVEHDTPLVTDCPIEWRGLVDLVVHEVVHVVRLHHEAVILEPHRHLMLDHDPHRVPIHPRHGNDSPPILRTVQWSQRPHLASASYYRRILRENFPSTGATMIEDKMHSVVQVEGWHAHRLAIYAPDGGNLKRSLHTDGRGRDPKFDMRYE